MFKHNDNIQEAVPNYTTYDYRGPFARAVTIANHYGFRLTKPLSTTCIQDLDEDFLDDGYKKASVAAFAEYTKHGSPFLACHTRNPRRKVGSLVLEAHACPKSIAEALTIKAALAILKDKGVRTAEVELNSIGDAEARARFKKHYTDFLKKYISRIPGEYQAELRQNPFLLHKIAEHDEFLKEISQDAPWSLNYLSEADRRHLKEVVEYLECMDIPYRINPALIGNPDSSSHTFFRIRSTGRRDSSVLANGERFEYASGMQKRQSVSVSVRLTAGKHESYKETKKATRSPKVYFLHLGPEAKRKGFMVLDILRDIQVPAGQNIIRDSLTEQMMHAEASRASHFIIMGIKEAQENSVIVRNTETRVQDVLELPRLRSYLKTVVK